MTTFIWQLTVNLTKEIGDLNDLRASASKLYSYGHLFQVENVKEAKKFALEYTKKKLARLKCKSGERIDAAIMAAPILQDKEGSMFDATRMLRNRSKFRDINILMKELNSEKVFVEGYGPKQAEELLK